MFGCVLSTHFHTNMMMMMMIN